jgi:hypothetical protein
MEISRKTDFENCCDMEESEPVLLESLLASMDEHLKDGVRIFLLTESMESNIRLCNSVISGPADLCPLLGLLGGMKPVWFLRMCPQLSSGANQGTV